MATAEPCATVRETVSFEGVGLHTGETCRVAIHPVAAANAPCAITIRKGASVFPARWDFVVDTTRATVLGDGATRISTVEHLMAALWITGITHCEIEVLQGNEIPILDGSALPFVQALGAVKIANPPSPQPSPPLQRGERETESPLNPSSSPHFVKGERETESPLNPSSSLLAWAEGVGALPLSRVSGEGEGGRTAVRPYTFRPRQERGAGVEGRFCLPLPLYKVGRGAGVEGRFCLPLPPL